MDNLPWPSTSAPYTCESGYTGGPGYSGGGGDGGSGTAGEGGSDGSDGFGDSDGGCPGGPGSGLDISTIPLKSFSITPGAGRMPSVDIGGGGGGVLIDSEGPPNTCSSYPEAQGLGYGGGGHYSNCEGFDGVLILDFV